MKPETIGIVVVALMHGCYGFYSRSDCNYGICVGILATLLSLYLVDKLFTCLESA